MERIGSLVVLVALASGAHGYCYISYNTNVTGVLGGVRKACVIPDLNITITVGGVLKSMDTCERYTCTESMLEVCGFGSRAGVFSVPGCRMEEVACLPKFVQDENSDTKCIAPNKPKPTPFTRPMPSSDYVSMTTDGPHVVCGRHDLDPDTRRTMCGSGAEKVRGTLPFVLLGFLALCKLA